MTWSSRLRHATRAASLHLVLSLLAAAPVAWLVFAVWYPAPFHELTGGRSLFLLLMAVDVVCGPVLTLVLYNPTKSRVKWRVDLALIVMTQLAALAYGLNQVVNARPVFVAYEGDRFRVVQAMDIDTTRLSDAPARLRALSYDGPRLLGVRLANSKDADYLTSLQLSIQGLHPAFRPSRWLTYDEQVPALLQTLRPIGVLREKNAERHAELDVALKQLAQQDAQMGYLPLVLEDITDWVVLVRRSDGQPLAYLRFDGW